MHTPKAWIESQRRPLEAILDDLAHHKMVLLSGPRQCGKTTLARSLMKAGDGCYNYDIEEDRKRIQRSALAPQANLWVFDELHKFNRWSLIGSNTHSKTFPL